MAVQVRVLNERCLPLSRWRVTCDTCRAHCPTNALSFFGNQLLVSDRCFGCGRCAAACPTGALAANGFDRIAEEISVVEGAVIRLDCERVSREDSAPGATRVPCLGGLGTDTLMELATAADGRPIRLMDRGWCVTCPAGGEGFSLDSMVASVRAVLEAAGCDSPALPAIERRPLPVVRCNGEPGTGGDVSRRGLFSRLSMDTPARRGDDRLFPPATRRVAGNDAVRRLAKRNNRPLSAIFPRAFVSESCADRRICVAACPTGALAVQERGSLRDVVFAPDRCFVCGRCENVCPTGSIHVAASGGRIEKTVLAVREISICAECEDEFVDRDGMGLCAACRKEKSILVNSLIPGTSTQGTEESAP